jgi:hypothetical protein
MLDRERQGFYLQEFWLTQQAIYIDAQGMCSQLADQTSAQAPEGMGIVLFNSELI